MFNGSAEERKENSRTEIQQKNTDNHQLKHIYA
jgi:hypothetical protein